MTPGHGHAGRWLLYARDDLAQAERILDQDAFAPRHVCWLAQQAAEKVLKTLLTATGTQFPRTHDLELLRSLVPIDLEIRASDLAPLTEYAVEARYPGDWPELTEREAREAVALTQSLMAQATTELQRRGIASP
jgi:HEPN domain-containing protein